MSPETKKKKRRKRKVCPCGTCFYCFRCKRWVTMGWVCNHATVPLDQLAALHPAPGDAQ